MSSGADEDAAGAPGAEPVEPLDPGGRAVVREVASAGALAVVAVLGTMAAWTVVPVAVGWRSDVVVSGSMLPAIRPGDVVVTSPLDEAARRDLPVGAVVLFPAGSGGPESAPPTVLHRVVSRDGATLTTRGDANQSDDTAAVAVDDVIGVGRVRVPLLGLPAVWVRERAWTPLAVSAAGLAAVVALASRRPSDGVADEPAADDELGESEPDPSELEPSDVSPAER